MLGMASDPVFQEGLGQCPQDTAVPRCSPNDIIPKVHPFCSSSADTGVRPFWGPMTLGVRGQRLRSAWPAEFRKSVDFLRPPGYTVGLRSFVYSPVHGMRFAQA